MFELPLKTDDGIPRYRVSELYYDTEDLWLTVQDREVKGRVRFTGAGKPRFRRYVSLRNTEDLAGSFEPSLWRPVHVWPYELPDTAGMTVEVVLPKPTVSPSLPPLHVGTGNYWPYPHVTLGRPNEKPESSDEAEARYLRAIRTHWMMTKEQVDISCLWPRPWMIESALIGKTLYACGRDELPWFRAGDKDDFHIDRSNLEARPVPFEPTPRDVSEWEFGRWINWRPVTDAGLIESQAKNPPPSFSELADTLSTTVAAIARRYEAAKDELYRRAIA